MTLVMQAQANNKKMTELMFLLSKSSSSATLQGNNSDNLIRSQKNLAKKIWNYQHWNKLNLEGDLQIAAS